MQYPSMAQPLTPTRFVLSLYHTPSAASREVFYSVLRAGHLVGGPEHHLRRDHYPGHELILCLKGRGAVRVGGRPHSVAAGELAWVNCHHPHEYQAEARLPWELFWMRIEGPQLDRLCTILSLQNTPVVAGLDFARARAVFRRVFELLPGGRPDASARIHAELARLIALVFTARQASGRLAPGEPDIPLALARSVERMRLYYHQPLRLAELAALARLSTSHFIRLFKATMGTTPIDWLRRERITQAKRRLIESEDTIKEIAGQCGYSDQFFFSRDFKQMTGWPPSEFRRRERGGSAAGTAN